MKLHKLGLAIVAGLMVLAQAALAGQFPRGCEVSGFNFQDDFLILNDKGDQAFYLIENRSDDLIEMERFETREVFMSPSLQALINPANWAAFASDIANQHFQCFRHQGENIQKINCQDALEVCRYPRVRFALSNMGNYWVSVNKNQNEVIQDAVSKGIYLKW